jgi:hypothetical protein
MAARMAPAILLASNDISEPSGKCLARADFWEIGYRPAEKPISAKPSNQI